jgi:hypothetical protein
MKMVPHYFVNLSLQKGFVSPFGNNSQWWVNKQQAKKKEITISLPPISLGASLQIPWPNTLSLKGYAFAKALFTF